MGVKFGMEEGTDFAKAFDTVPYRRLLSKSWLLFMVHGVVCKLGMINYVNNVCLDSNFGKK